jgi:hypothetical protein
MGPKLFTLPGNDRFILLGAILLIYLAFQAFRYFSSQNKPKKHLPLGTPRAYGIAGGAICPNCHRPSPLSLIGLKLGFGVKFVRCEFCGKWSWMRRVGLDELRAAEAAELTGAQAAQPIPQKSETDRLKDLADESRFTDQGG